MSERLVLLNYKCLIIRNNISPDFYYNIELETYVKYKFIMSCIRDSLYYLNIKTLIFFNIFLFFTFYFINKYI